VRLAHGTIVVSRVLERYVAEKYGGGLVRYLPNGTNVEPPRGEEPIRERWGLRSGRYFLTVGSLIPDRGLGTLIEAYRGLRTDLKLVIVGDSRYTDDYAERLRDTDDPRVLFTGRVIGEALASLYSNAYAYVHPSEVEGLPISLLEAMSFGRCVVTSDIPENLEAQGGTGLSFPTRNAVGLQKVLSALLSDPERAEEAGRRARERVREVYDWESITDRTVDFYREVMEASHASHAG
jgi:glycosyltransferase involved in cell wall biosynthesis